MPPLDVSCWDLRRSLQIHCLLVSYRTLAWLVFDEQRLRLGQSFIALRCPHSCYFDSQRADIIFGGSRCATDTLHSATPQHAVAATASSGKASKTTAAVRHRRDAKSAARSAAKNAHHGIANALRPRQGRLRRRAAPPRRRQSKFRYREGHKSLPIRKRPPRPAAQRPGVITSRITRHVIVGLSARERGRGL